MNEDDVKEFGRLFNEAKRLYIEKRQAQTPEERRREFDEAWDRPTPPHVKAMVDSILSKPRIECDDGTSRT